MNRKDVQKTRRKKLPPLVLEAMDQYFNDQRLISAGGKILADTVDIKHLACLDPAHRNHPKRLDFKVNL